MVIIVFVVFVFYCDVSRTGRETIITKYIVLHSRKPDQNLLASGTTKMGMGCAKGEGGLVKEI